MILTLNRVRIIDTGFWQKFKSDPILNFFFFINGLRYFMQEAIKECTMESYELTEEACVVTLETLFKEECDALEAYDAAIKRLKDPHYRANLLGFMEDHNKVMEDLVILLRIHGLYMPSSPSLTRQFMAKWQMLLANLGGDKAILRALQHHEGSIKQTYQQADARQLLWPHAKNIVTYALDRVDSHDAWFEDVLGPAH